MPAINGNDKLKSIVKIVDVTKENKSLYRMPNDPADIDEAFIESLEVAKKKLKNKVNLPKDKFDKE